MFCFAIIISTLILLTEGNYYYYSSSNGGNGLRNCRFQSHGITTDRQLQEAIDRAVDGDHILLDPIQYNGTFTINNKNTKTIALIGDNQCNQNTRIKGQFVIRSNYWVISGMVLEGSVNAIDVQNSNWITLSNLVINDITGNAVNVNSCSDVFVNNLVINRVDGNAVTFESTSTLEVNNMVASNVRGIGIQLDNCSQIQIKSCVMRNVGREVIKTTGDSHTGRIANTIINGNSPSGEGWMAIDGYDWVISNTIANGAPKDGVVVKGCNFVFNGNILSMGGQGYGIHLLNKRDNCHHQIGITNLINGGSGLYNN